MEVFELELPRLEPRKLAVTVAAMSATIVVGAVAQAQSVGLTPCPRAAAALSCSGTFRFPDGVIYSGEFRDGRRHGVGAFVFPDGRRQLHEFEADAVTGQGVRYRADGSIESSGTFAYGQLVRAHPVEVQTFDRRIPTSPDPPFKSQLAGPDALQALAPTQAVLAMTVDGRTLSFVPGTSAANGPFTGSISIFDIIDMNGRSSIKIIPRNPD
jgi:hypothetical protein